MQPETLLIKILSATKAEDVFSIRFFKKEYTEWVKLLHPDVCSLPLAGQAVARLNTFRKEMEKYTGGEDDAGRYTLTAENEVHFTGEAALLQQSYRHYQLLMQVKGDAAKHFQQYLPQSMVLTNDTLVVKSDKRMLPLTHLTLPASHTNWVLSRIFELISWLQEVGYCHLGICPESVFIVPETHGIVCTSFYHLTPVNTKPTTLSGRYLSWYPAVIFDRKKAHPYIDISLAQRLAIYLLGDKSGNGIVLKKTENPALIDFLITPHYDPFSTYDVYRKLLRQQFGKPTFHSLNI